MKRAGESLNDFEFAEREANGKVRVTSAGAGTEARGKGGVVQLPAESMALPVEVARLPLQTTTWIYSVPALWTHPCSTTNPERQRIGDPGEMGSRLR
jgi:hypothetical protein